jgi:hypothetical protein
MMNKVVKETKNSPIVTRIDLPASFMAIPMGETATYDCQTIGNYSTVYSAVRRLNEKLGKQAFLFDTPDNGATYLITHTENAEA